MAPRILNSIGCKVARLGRWAFMAGALLALSAFGLVAAIWGWQQAAVLCGLAAGPFLLSRIMIERSPTSGRTDDLTGLPGRGAIITALDTGPSRLLARRGETGAFVIEIDRFRRIEETQDHAGVERILTVVAHRLAETMRESDLVGRLEGPTFAVALGPEIGLDLEAAIVLAGRIQRALAQPIAVGGANVYITASIGFALAGRHNQPKGKDLLQMATLAMIEAQRSGPSAIRSYSEALHNRITSRTNLAGEMRAALEDGQILAFYQPQISARSGHITGFEALARWQHPERGLIAPNEFLPALEQAGLMDRLSEIMIHNALSALRKWEDRGFRIPRVGVNFSNQELCDPRLVDRIATELARFDLTPDRLVVEVLETVVAGKTDDVVRSNLAGLASLGCCLDLDDFGTGHASITSIRRLLIERIKIDRSFVTGIDEDPEQQKMVAAILTMAERLGIDTLAEGVETPEEQDMLRRLGCGHLQGFGISRPMPIQATFDWLEARITPTRTASPVRLKAV